MSHKKERTTKATIATLVTVFGSTAGVWLMYFLALFFDKMIKDVTWPGINSFIYDGTFLIVSFSIFTSTLVATLTSKSINRYNIMALGCLLATTIIYTKVVGLGSAESVAEKLSPIWLLLPFFISIIILFFTYANRKKVFLDSSWLSGAEVSKKEFSIFISYSITGTIEKNRDKVRADAKQIIDTLSNLGYDIFNAHDYFGLQHELQEPKIAAREDFTAIENSRNFVLFYPSKAPSSSLIELGYALRDGDNILIITPTKDTLPFLARGLSELNSKKINIVEYKSLGHAIKKIKRNHSTYFKGYRILS